MTVHMNTEWKWFYKENKHICTRVSDIDETHGGMNTSMVVVDIPQTNLEAESHGPHFIKSRTDGQGLLQRFCLHFAFRWWSYKMSNWTLPLKWETDSGRTINRFWLVSERKVPITQSQILPCSHSLAVTSCTVAMNLSCFLAQAFIKQHYEASFSGEIIHHSKSFL